MRNTRAAHAARFILIATALLLPTLSLVPLGGLYLWEKGWLLWWAIVAATVITIVYVTQKYLFSSSEFTTAEVSVGQTDAAGAPSSAGINPNWTTAERKAWRDVEAIAARVNPDKLTTSKAIFDLGHHTVNVVAQRMHPTKSDALWQFTLPEALAISERVSQRLGRFVEDTIPFGDRLTVSQVLTVYSWRSVADVAEKAYDIWRIIRLANPVTAVTHEARERLSRAMLAWGKDHVSRQLAETFVLEVGKAAIDLYGGRLRISRDDILENRLDPGIDPASSGTSPPLRILVTGPARGRLPLVIAALEDMRQERADNIAAFVRGEKSHADLLSLTAFDIVAAEQTSRAASSGSSSRDTAALIRDSREADIIIWVQNSASPPDDHDSKPLQKLEAAGHPVPPVLLPLVFNAGDTGALTDALLAELSKLYQGHIAKPVLAEDDAAIGRLPRILWPRIAAITGEARRVQYARALESVRNRRDWSGAARQAASAAGALAKSMLPSLSSKSDQSKNDEPR